MTELEFETVLGVGILASDHQEVPETTTILKKKKKRRETAIQVLKFISYCLDHLPSKQISPIFAVVHISMGNFRLGQKPLLQ